MTLSKIVVLALVLVNELSAAARSVGAAKEPLSATELWLYSAAVLLGSFLLALMVGLRETLPDKESTGREPGVDAYIEQMALANGAYLKRD